MVACSLFESMSFLWLFYSKVLLILPSFPIFSSFFIYFFLELWTSVSLTLFMANWSFPLWFWFMKGSSLGDIESRVLLEMNMILIAQYSPVNRDLNVLLNMQGCLKQILLLLYEFFGTKFWNDMKSSESVLYLTPKCFFPG